MRQQNRLTPVKEYKAYRRNLPHIEVAGSTYFVTFRTATGISLSSDAREFVLGAIKYHAGIKYDLHACVVMETHVHIIFQPLEAQAGTPVPRKYPLPVYSLAQIMHSIKSYSSKGIRPIISAKNSIWLDENFDRIIETDNEYDETMDYIIYNPVKAGLVKTPGNYEWLYVRDR